MFCAKCGKEIKDGSAFCIHCGAPVSGRGQADSGGAATARSGKKTLLILAVMIAVFFVILITFFRIVQEGRNSDDTVGDTDGVADIAEEQPFAGFSGSLSIGDKVVFGKYEQDCNITNGAEPLEWDVIGQEGNMRLLISHYIIDYKQYDDGTADVGVNAGGSSTDAVVTWEKCSLRKWLNSDFYTDTFTDKERSYITPVKNPNPSWKDFDTGTLGASKDAKGGYGGNVTEDKVFLLAFYEIPSYLGPTVFVDFYQRSFFPGALATATPYMESMTESGTCLSMEKLFGSDESRRNPEGTWRKYYDGYVDYDYIQKEAFTSWFSRSPGCWNDGSGAFAVLADGSPDPARAKSLYSGVRPALWVTVD